ncbi:centrosomal protein of 135 kDa [Microcaecilia unicolor]|uniref:Centrosomal protein of 135 kDa n=1 Tax=Microcaecilia unicolor TaxID=1415580 RepID=A0A6P7X1M4_9AMPH|nr:centrosomal protein of 135 kDa [Microcaecilia unicolor]
MSTAMERKFTNLRKRLDQLGYRQPLGIESLPLVEKLFSDLVHTTESLRNAKLTAGKTEKENKNFDALLEPYKTENARVVRENNELHIELLKLKEESDRHIKDLKVTLRKLEHQTADLKFLNNQYIHKIRLLEKDSKAKSEKIQQLQEKNLQAVVQTPGGKKRMIPFRRQRMQIDQPVPPSGIAAYPVPQPQDPYVTDLLQVADNRIQELQQDVAMLQDKLEVSEQELKHLSKQVEVRDCEIERLGIALDGGRSHDVISLEARTKSSEKLIAHLNLQVEYLQQANQDLEKRLQALMETRENVTSEVMNLSTKNNELCQELTEIDKLAQQLERDKEIVLKTADAEIQDAKNEIKKQFNEIQNMERTISELKAELSTCQGEKYKMAEELLAKAEENLKLESFLNHLEQEKQRYLNKVEKLTATERDLVLEVEKMRTQYGILRGDRSPSRLDMFVKSLEEERDYYKKELENVERTFKRRSSPLNNSRQETSPSHDTPEKSGTYNSELRQIIRERDELQSMLDRFEKHMTEIQSNVKMLTAERDKLNILYDQAQDELAMLRQERQSKISSALENQTALHHIEEERNKAITDLKKVAAEKENLQKLKSQHESISYEKSKMEQKISDLENTIYVLEKERFDLKSSISVLRETMASLENEVKTQSYKLSQTSDDFSQQKIELGSVRLMNEQLQRSLEDAQHRLSVKKDELQLSQEQIVTLENRIDELNHNSSSQQEELNMLRSTVSVLDKEKDVLQETVDDKTERIACLDDNLSNKEKTVANLRLTVSDLESSVDQLKDLLSNKDRELASIHHQLDVTCSELSELKRLREIALKENRRLQDDLATMTRENQAVSTELESAMHEKEDLKLRVHSYISEVARTESLMAAKEQENRDLLDQFRMMHGQAEDWEVKAHRAEGESSSIRLELLSVDTDRRHLRERVEHLENEIQEHINAHQAYELQISSMAKTMSRLEEELKHEQNQKASVLSELSSVRDLCVKLDSNKELFSRQLTSKSMEYERIVAELGDVKSETELLKKQLASERLTIQNLETLLATNREKEFQSHLSSHEKDSEIQLLKDKLTLSESKLNNQTREVSMLRSKVAQLQTEFDIMKRQLTTERFERERAVQELRRHGLSTSSVRTSSPICLALKSPTLSPERSILRSTDRGTDKSSEKCVSFKE